MRIFVFYLQYCQKYTELSESFYNFASQVTCDPSAYDCNHKLGINFEDLPGRFKPEPDKYFEEIEKYFQ